MKSKDLINILSRTSGYDLVAYLDIIDDKTQKKIIDYVTHEQFDDKMDHIIKIDEMIQKITPLKNVDPLVIEKVKAIQSAILTQPTDDPVTATLSLIKGAAEEYEHSSILRAVKKLPPEQRADIVKKTLPLLQGITEGDARRIILNAVRDISPDARDDVIEKALPFLLEITDGIYRYHFLMAVRDIPPDERDAVIQLVQPLIKIVKNEAEKVHILEAISSIPQAQRNEEVLSAIFSLCKDAHDPQYIADIILDTIPTERARVIKRIEFMMKEVVNIQLRSDIFRAIVRMPAEQRGPGVISEIISAFKKIDDAAHRADIIETIRICPNKDQDENEVVSAIIALFKDILDVSQRIDILKKLDDTYRIHRAFLIVSAQPLTQNTQDGNKRAQILTELSKFRKSEMAETALLIQPLMPYLSLDQIPEVFEVIRHTLRSDRANLIEITLHCFRNFTDMTSIAKIILEVALISVRVSNKEVVSALFLLGYRTGIFALFKDVDDEEERVKMLTAIEKTPKENRLKMVLASAEFRKKIDDNAEMIEIMETLSNFPSGNFDKVLAIFKENNGSA